MYRCVHASVFVCFGMLTRGKKCIFTVGRVGFVGT